MAVTNFKYLSTLPGLCKIGTIVLVIISISAGGHAYENSLYNIVYNFLQQLIPDDIMSSFNLPGLGREKFFLAVVGMIFVFSVLSLIGHIMNIEYPYDRNVKLTDIAFHAVGALLLIIAGSLIIASSRKINKDVCSGISEFPTTTTINPTISTSTTTRLPTSLTTPPVQTTTQDPSPPSTSELPSSGSTTELPTPSTDMTEEPLPSISTTEDLSSSTTEGQTSPRSSSTEGDAATEDSNTVASTTESPITTSTTEDPTTTSELSSSTTSEEPSSTTDELSTVDLGPRSPKELVPSRSKVASDADYDDDEADYAALEINEKSEIIEVDKQNLNEMNLLKFLKPMVEENIYGSLKCQYRAEKDVAGSFAIIGSFLYGFVAVVQFLRFRNDPPIADSTMMHEIVL